jgi:hypothetical protein
MYTLYVQKIKSIRDKSQIKSQIHIIYYMLVKGSYLSLKIQFE